MSMFEDGAADVKRDPGMMELSVTDLQAVSGGETRTVIAGKNCSAEVHPEKDGSTTVIVYCQQ